MNALLTQIDLLRRRRNVLVMATSNLTNAIGRVRPRLRPLLSTSSSENPGGRCDWATDDAFLDRADIKQFIGLPTRAAVYQILCTCTHELMRVGIVAPAVCDSTARPGCSPLRAKTDDDDAEPRRCAVRRQVPLMERQVVEYLHEPMNETARSSRRLLAIADRCQVRRPEKRNGV